MKQKKADGQQCPWCKPSCATEGTCVGSRWNCARFMLINTVGPEHLPDDLHPMEMARAIHIARRLAA